jgi:hypothetical protein
MNAAQIEILRGHQAEVPVRVGRLAGDLGLEVVLSSLGKNVSGLIEPSETAPEGFAIKVNRYETPERQRFTIAHEISHFLLHRDFILTGVVDNVMYRSSLGSKKETEANRLAAEILMPMQKIKDELDRLGLPVGERAARELSSIFKVSVPAMKVRLGIAD